MIVWVIDRIDAADGQIRAQAMGAVTVLTANVMGDDHFRFIFSDLLNNKPERGVFPIFFIRFFQMPGIHIRETAQDGIMHQAKAPQAIQQFASPHGSRVGKQHGQNLQAALSGIIGQQAAEKQHLIIGMGKQQHHVGIFIGRSPLLHPRRELSV